LHKCRFVQPVKNTSRLKIVAKDVDQKALVRRRVEAWCGLPLRMMFFVGLLLRLDGFD
jgi:hypothetical protein